MLRMHPRVLEEYHPLDQVRLVKRSVHSLRLEGRKFQGFWGYLSIFICNHLGHDKLETLTKQEREKFTQKTEESSKSMLPLALSKYIKENVRRSTPKSIFDVYKVLRPKRKGTTQKSPPYLHPNQLMKSHNAHEPTPT